MIPLHREGWFCRLGIVCGVIYLEWWWEVPCSIPVSSRSQVVIVSLDTNILKVCPALHVLQRKGRDAVFPFPIVHLILMVE